MPSTRNDRQKETSEKDVKRKRCQEEEEEEEEEDEETQRYPQTPTKFQPQPSPIVPARRKPHRKLEPPEPPRTVP